MIAVSDIIATAPWAFLLGVIVGLGLSSRYRIIRQRQPED